MDNTIKIGYCVAYDWSLLEYSIPMVYDFADKICLSIDKNRISWSGNKYLFESGEFYRLIRKLDKANKILVVEGSYYLPTLSPMENEVRQRNKIAEFLGTGGWHIQLDCDEYFMDFEAFVLFLKSLPDAKRRRTNICCPWITLFKRTPDGFLFIDPVNPDNLEYMQIATQYPLYEYSRRNGNFNIYTNFRILHQSWARDEHEVIEKINNWGHSADLDKAVYLGKWKELTSDNFHLYSNLHTLVPSLWPKLGFVKGATILDVVQGFKHQVYPELSPGKLFFKNSIFFSRLRKLFNRR